MNQRNHGWIVFLRGSAVFLCLLLASCGRQELDTLRFEDEQVLYGQTSRIQGFDPAKSGDVASSMVISRMYEGLLQYSYLKRPYQVEPLLAESLPTVSEDGLTYTFKIRNGIFFQDDPCFPDGKGRELTAEDFVYAIKRVADVKNASSGYWAFNRRIVGLDDFRASSAEAEPTDYDAVVEGLRALDDHTLQIQLTGPYPQLLWILAMHYSFAVPREAVEAYGDDFVNHPVGTGPFILHRWKRNYRVEFVRNPKWAETGRVELYPTEGSAQDRAAGLLEDAGKPIPFLDRIVQYVVDDSTTAWMMFLSGHFSFSSISRDNWDVVITPDKELVDDLQKQKIRLLASPTLDLFYIGFNMDDPVVGRNRKLRQALSCAYNPEVMVQYYNGRITPVYGPVPDPLAGFKPEPTAYSYNPEKAKRLLAEAGYPDGIDPETGRRLEVTLELGSAGGDTSQQIDLLIDMFDQVGIVLKASYNNWPTFLDKMDRRQAQLFQLGWVADYPDPENFLQLFYSANVSPGPNHANYVNPEFDALYEKIRFLLPGEEKDRLCKQMADIIIEDCPWIFMHQPMSYALVHNWLENYKPHDFPYGMTKYRRADNKLWNQWKAENK
ncbi:ABC transporter substrate-binding protein [Tichowtungia aerotolerans]|uniref:ABC transporter substrate-binding protein n=1 Tax=Tichowtungia aerotolerans TaxID=2697043 RepID=A0A6P1M772_9BACT|nr:ABC transporter substrate-binding protein [Tichowtungia aerotolerans]QHI68883.1 ABC transporter substrate-binding protein [Tichowtungia aerotolerans]